MPNQKLSVGCVIAEPGSTVKNKTGGWRTNRPVRDAIKCTKCHICWQYCPENAIDKDINFNYDYCKGCGICAATCPVKCIQMVKEEK
jgi:2-oxoacid:acceptor oxidoreductase delta subunit (pyruvate/2-ketoisovalerate family)